VFENDGEQIKRLLRNSRQFDGVFSSDTLSASPRLLVCNLDPSIAKARTGYVFTSAKMEVENTLCVCVCVCVCVDWTDHTELAICYYPLVSHTLPPHMPPPVFATDTV